MTSDPTDGVTSVHDAENRIATATREEVPSQLQMQSDRADGSWWPELACQHRNIMIFRRIIRISCVADSGTRGELDFSAGSIAHRVMQIATRQRVFGPKSGFVNES